MILPFVLIFLATAAAGMAVYGTLSDWAQYSHGLEIILLTRRFQWPLFTFSVLLCLGLIVQVIVGKRRAWWLIGLGPILALFVHNFSTGTSNNYHVIENPPYVKASDATFLGDDDYVVGVTLNDTAYAYPYAMLYWNPVVIQCDREKRMMVMWSAFANRAVGVMVSREIKTRELEVVSMPANALLIYNSRLGQFINGLTARTPSGTKPSGFHALLQTSKTPWKVWRKTHPGGLVMAIESGGNSPAVPVLPHYPMPISRSALPVDSPIVMVATTQPVAIPVRDITPTPMNLNWENVPFFIFRDKATGQIRGFDRRIDQDLSPRFIANPSPRRAALGVAFLDTDSNSGWNTQGIAVDGDPIRKGMKLKSVPYLEEGLYWGVMKYWYPELQLYGGAEVRSESSEVR